MASLIFDILDLPIRSATNSLWNWYASRCIVDHGTETSKMPGDLNQWAKRMVDIATGEACD
jgi:hypothetical protein